MLINLWYSIKKGLKNKFNKLMDSLVIEGKDICLTIDQLLGFDEKNHILKAIFYCKYCLNFNEEIIKEKTYDEFYDKCKNYLEKTKKYL